MFQGGYMGRYAFVDLSRKTCETRELDENYAKLFIGGPALGARMLLDFMPAGTGPFDEKSVCGFVTGPLTGSGAFFGGRFTFVCKSPVTGGFNDANAGGTFGVDLKHAGLDALFITGIAANPVYLFAHDRTVDIIDASELWGMDYLDAEAKVKQELLKKYGIKASVSGIGQAGEHLSHIAAVMADTHHAAGRGGGGAVLGSKNVKLVAAGGTEKIPVFDPEKLKEHNKTVAETARSDDYAGFRDHGTGNDTPALIMTNDSSVKNWASPAEDYYTEQEAFAVGSESMDPKYKVKKYACYACPFGCGAVYDVKDGKWPVGITQRPQYETQAAFSSMLLNKDPMPVIKCNDLCNRYGLDTISAGATVAWVFDAYDNGELTKEDLDGIEATWGNGDAAVQLIEKMGTCDGCGAVLVHGSQYAADTWGKGKEQLVTFSGIEPGMHDPRFLPGLARTYQYDPTPGRHVKGGTAWTITDEKYDFSEQGPHNGIIDVESASYGEFENAVGICQFCSVYGVSMYEPVYDMVTGWSISGEGELVEFGRRSFLTRLCYNIREGLKKEDYTASPRILGIPKLPRGVTKGVTIENTVLADRFFRALGCDPDTFYPTRKTLLQARGLDDMAETLPIKE